MLLSIVSDLDRISEWNQSVQISDYKQVLTDVISGIGSSSFRETFLVVINNECNCFPNWLSSRTQSPNRESPIRRWVRWGDWEKDSLSSIGNIWKTQFSSKSSETIVRISGEQLKILTTRLKNSSSRWKNSGTNEKRGECRTGLL